MPATFQVTSKDDELDSKDLQEYIKKYLLDYDSTERLTATTFKFSVAEQDVERFKEYLEDQRDVEWELL